MHLTFTLVHLIPYSTHPLWLTHISSPGGSPTKLPPQLGFLFSLLSRTISTHSRTPFPPRRVFFFCCLFLFRHYYVINFRSRRHRRAANFDRSSPRQRVPKPTLPLLKLQHQSNHRRGAIAANERRREDGVSRARSSLLA